MKKLNLKKLWRIIETKLWFYMLQAILLFIVIILVSKNYLVPLDLNIRHIFMNLRNNSDYITAKLDSDNIRNKITLIWIDEKFFDEERISVQWLHRWYYAKVLSNINQNNPAVIWVDVFFQNKYNFSEDDSKWKMLNKIFWTYDSELAGQLNKNTVIPVVYNFEDNIIYKPDDLFLSNWVELWHVHSANFLRNTNIWIYHALNDDKNTDPYIPMWLKTFIMYHINNYKKNFKWVEVLPSIKKEWNILNIKINHENIYIPLIKSKLTTYYQDFIFTPLYLREKDEKINYLSFYDVYKWNFDKSLIEDKVVFIWATDITLNDIKNTVFGPIPWIVIHINSFISYLLWDFIYILDWKNILILSISILLINTIFIWIFRNTSWSRDIAILLLIEIIILIILSVYLSIYGTEHFWYNIFLPLWTISVIIFFQIIINLSFYLVETYVVKENFHKLFSLYVWEKLVETKTKNIYDVTKKSAEEKEVSMFFSDIAWFTSLSERFSPSENITFLNQYLDKMSWIIANHDWFIDKYIWDAIMAFWENEKWPENCIKSAILNYKKLKEVNLEVKDLLKLWKEENNLLDIRIWLNYWVAIVWDIWSEKYKLNHTIIWDQVNLTSRLEGINKFYKTKICMSEFLKEKLPEKNDFFYRRLDKIKVKWKNKPVVIYEILPLLKSELSYEELKNYMFYIKEFEEWIWNYFQWNFQQAIEKFKYLKEFKNDETLNIFIERSEHLIENTPENWEWVWEFKSK